MFHFDRASTAMAEAIFLSRSGSHAAARPRLQGKTVLSPPVATPCAPSMCHAYPGTPRRSTGGEPLASIHMSSVEFMAETKLPTRRSIDRDVLNHGHIAAEKTDEIDIRSKTCATGNIHARKLV